MDVPSPRGWRSVPVAAPPEEPADWGEGRFSSFTSRHGDNLLMPRPCVYSRLYIPEINLEESQRRLAVLHDNRDELEDNVFSTKSHSW
jgi:hypothetical protein